MSLTEYGIIPECDIARNNMTTKTYSKLLPCPFCGGDAEMDTRQGYLALGTGRPGNRIAVYCQHCDADMGVCIEDVPDITPEQVAEMWNRRAAVEADRCGQTPSEDEISELWSECTINHATHHGKADTLIRLFAETLLSRYGSSQPAASAEPSRCEDCPPVGYPTDETRCAPCDRRSAPVVQEPYRDIPENGYEFRRQAAPVATQPAVTDEMVSRFLGWHLPKDFAPDAGISFNPSPNPLCWPVGTNLLTDPQARAMLEYVLKGAPVTAWGDRGPAAS